MSFFDQISKAIGTDSSNGFIGNIGKQLTQHPDINNLYTLAALPFGPAVSAGVNATVNRAQGRDWNQTLHNAAGAALGSYGLGKGAEYFMGTGTGSGAAGAVGGATNPMYSLSGGTGTFGAGSAGSTSAGMMGPGMTAGSGMGGAAGMGGGTGVLGSLGSIGSAGGGTSFLSNLSNIGNIAKAGSSLYSAFQGKEGADATQNALQDQMLTLRDMYKEGSPWANQLKEQLARKDAAAGRNSQYGARLANYQAQLADRAGQNAGILGSLATQAGAANTNSNNYLNLLLNRGGDLAKSVGITDDVIKDGARDAWDYFFGP